VVFLNLQSGLLGEVSSQNTAIDGFNVDGTGWTINSDYVSSSAISNDVLTLTDNVLTGEARSAWYNTPINTNSFSAQFVYQVGPVGQSLADGIALVFQTQGLAAIGQAGGSLGYVGITGPTAAYQMNVYQPNGQGTNFVTTNTSGTYNTTGNVHVSSGDPILIELTYDATAFTMTATLTDLTTSSTYTTTYDNVDFASLFGDAPIYLGFTGGDGGVKSLQTVSDFFFTQDSNYGDVSITHQGSLVSASDSTSGTVVVAGNNITLSSHTGSVGTFGNPLVLQATGTTHSSGGIFGGVINANAQSDIYLVQSTGDMRVGQIISDEGLVSLSAPQGSLLNAINIADLGVSSAQANQALRSLMSENPVPLRQTIAAFERQIDSAYQQYWQLLSSGTVQSSSAPIALGTQALYTTATQGTFTLSLSLEDQVSLSNTATGGTFSISVSLANQFALTNNATGGTFTVTLSSDQFSFTSDPLPYNATSIQIQTALSRPGWFVSVTGTGSTIDPWVIAADGLTGLTTDDSLLVSGVSQVVGQPVWTTAPIAYNASPAVIQSALNALPGILADVSYLGTNSSVWYANIPGLESFTTDDSLLTGGVSTITQEP
jgi:hypothetical protein